MSRIAAQGCVTPLALHVHRLPPGRSLELTHGMRPITTSTSDAATTTASNLIPIYGWACGAGSVETAQPWIAKNACASLPSINGRDAGTQGNSLPRLNTLLSPAQC
jgi:hypothetical protein